MNMIKDYKVYLFFSLLLSLSVNVYATSHEDVPAHCNPKLENCKLDSEIDRTINECAKGGKCDVRYPDAEIKANPKEGTFTIQKK